MMEMNCFIANNIYIDKIYDMTFNLPWENVPKVVTTTVSTSEVCSSCIEYKLLSAAPR